jgi:hypothetical protein
MPVVGQDDKFFLTDTGGRISKGALSSSKRKEYEDLLSSPTSAPIAEPVMTIPNRANFENAIGNVRGFLRDITNRPEDAVQATAPQVMPASVAPGTVASAPVMPPVTGPFAAAIGKDFIPQFDISSPAALAGQQQLASTTPLLPASSTSAAPAQPDLYAQGSGALDEFNAGRMLSVAGARKQANAIMQANQDTEKESLRLQEEQAKINTIIQERQEQRDRSIGEAQKNITDTLTELQQKKIDPDRFFEGSTGKRIMAGIAIAFGEIGRALTGSQTNNALKIINDAIDRDVLSQKEDIATAKEGLSLKRQAMLDLRQRFGDEEQSLLARKAINLEMAQQKIADIGRRKNTAEALAQVDIINGDLQMKLADTMSKLFELKAAKDSSGRSAVNTAEDDLRKQREGSEEYKKTILRRDAVATMEAAAKQNTGAGDIALVFSYMKSLDPGSTVMRGEQADAQNAAGVPDIIRQKYNQALEGTRLGEKQRNEFLSASKSILNASEKQLSRRDDAIRKIIDKRGLNPEMIIINPSPQALTDQFTSFVPQDNTPQKPQTQTANRVMPGR